MTRPVLTLSALIGLGVLAASPASAQVLAPPPSSAQVLSSGVPSGPGGSGTEVLGNPSDIGITASTASRIPSSRREMNRGRSTPFAVGMSPRQTRRFASDLVGRAQIACDVREAMIVARTPENVSVLEVDCAQGGGLMIVDTVPIQATDCLDLPVVETRPTAGRAPMGCQLPGNVATVTAAGQSARN